MNISNKNNLENLYNKIKIILETKENVKYNINTNLLVDKLIFDMEGGIKNG